LHKATGTHSASKPYTFQQIKNYFDIAKEKRGFLNPIKKLG